MTLIVKEKQNLNKILDYLNNLSIPYKVNSTKELYLLDIEDTKNLLDEKILLSFEGVIYMTPLLDKPFLWSRKTKNEDTIIPLNHYTIDSKHITIIAGPCSIENKEQLNTIAVQVKNIGAHILRAGAFKPRTSPYDFQGLGKEGLTLLEQCKKEYKLPIISEITDLSQLDLFVDHVDIIQVGARNMQNYELLKALSKINTPILLKRGMGCTIEELLFSAEYLLKGGNNNVILCERGIKTFENSTRYTLDLSAIPVLKKLTHLPIFVDPSHAVGDWQYVESMSLAAIAAGADGLMIEVHHTPLCAKSDGLQSLNIQHFHQLMQKCKKIAQAVGKEIL